MNGERGAFFGDEGETGLAISTATEHGGDVIGRRLVWPIAAGVAAETFWVLVLAHEPTDRVGMLVAVRAEP